MVKRISTKSLIVGIAIAVMISLAPTPSQALEEGSGKQIGLGLGAAGANFLYIPSKLCYAATGTFVGGLAWLFSGGDGSVADPIFTAAWMGDYVLTEKHLTGEEPVEFIGRPYSDRYMVGEEAVEESFDEEYKDDAELPAVSSEGF